MWDANAFLNYCGYFVCLLCVIFVVTDGFSFVGLLVDACALFQCVLGLIVAFCGMD